MDKEQYRVIIETYFKAFDTGNFSGVKFSSRIQFLELPSQNPLDGVVLKPSSPNTFDGVEAVVNFVSDLSTRVCEVNILSITVDYPTASGVCQMRTTRGTLYTLNTFFRLDEEGIVYIWSMFDFKAIYSSPRDFTSWVSGNGY